MPYHLATPQRPKINGAGDKFRTCCLQSHNLALYRLSYARHIVVVRLERFEPPTHGLEGRCSILLSYRRVTLPLFMMERVMGIGPTQPAWKASVLPLNYTRIVYELPHNSMLKNYSKYVFLCQLILITKFYFFELIKIAPARDFPARAHIL